MKNGKIKTNLSELDLNEVSLVDRGANKKKRFPIWKQEDELKTFEEILKAVLKTEIDDEVKLLEYCEKAKLSDKGVQAIKAALRILSSFKSEIPDEAISKLAELAGFKKPENPMDDEEDKKIKKVDDDKKFDSLPDEVKKKLAEQDAVVALLQKQIETSQKMLQDNHDRNRLKEWEEAVKKDLSHYPGKVDEVAKTLFDLEKLNSEMAKAQFESMKKANEVMKKSSLFETIGVSSRSSDATASESKFEALIKEKVSKSEGMTYEQAYTDVLKNNPTLYTEYLEENPAQIGK